MKKLFILLTIFLIPLLSLSQTWDTFRIDSAVSVRLPKGFTKTESSKQFNLLARSSFGTILIFKVPDDPQITPDIEKERHLGQYYDNYLKSVRQSSKSGIITGEKNKLVGGLKVKDFTLQIDTGSGVLFRDFRILHANAATYTFEFLYQDIHKEYAVPEREKFFNSIEINEIIGSSDQFTSHNPNSDSPDNSQYLILLILIVLLGIGLNTLRIVLKNAQRPDL
ncbi:MAG: hypothetical protein Q8S11_04070 [Daejeonella sp.]|uniref:hypothetical protein n=1 Tax=Daejeonella sp. TaxID=2805397 RepID=UPI002736F80D|nr:hypothetical protein [Daejeonella sp.]MDP3467481.1 hypothetical protein [Daejeonella sp.]